MLQKDHAAYLNAKAVKEFFAIESIDLTPLSTKSPVLNKRENE